MCTTKVLVVSWRIAEAENTRKLVVVHRSFHRVCVIRGASCGVMMNSALGELSLWQAGMTVLTSAMAPKGKGLTTS